MLWPPHLSSIHFYPGRALLKNSKTFRLVCYANFHNILVNCLLLLLYFCTRTHTYTYIYIHIAFLNACFSAFFSALVRHMLLSNSVDLLNLLNFSKGMPNNNNNNHSKCCNSLAPLTLWKSWVLKWKPVSCFMCFVCTHFYVQYVWLYIAAVACYLSEIPWNFVTMKYILCITCIFISLIIIVMCLINIRIFWSHFACE